MKKLLCPLFALLIVLSLSTAAFAADYSAEESANALYELGLFQGTGETANGKPIYSLDAAPTRAQAVTMLVRLLGKEAEAKAGTWTVPFSDLADWARPYVGYAYANGLTNGLSAERFGSDDKVTANQYLTFILRALGYSSERDFQWDKANAFSDSLGLTHEEYRASRSFTRGDTARISFAALAQARKDSSETLAAQLVRQGAVKAKTAAECGLVLAADSGGFLNIAGSRYTLQNADGKYLAASGDALTLSDKPFAWYALPAAGDSFTLRPDNKRAYMLDVSNAWFEEGNRVGICDGTGHDAQHWKLYQSGRDTWQLVCSLHPELALSVSSGGAALQKRGNAGTNWQLTLVGTERDNYMEIEGRSDVITMRLERRVLDVLSRARLQKWVNDLETAYADYAELTGWTPYRHVYINMLAPETAWGYACEGGIIQIDADCIYEDLSLNFARRKNDWNFGLLHELSHLFEADSRPWDFHAEVLADYKLAYVMTKNNCAAVPADWYNDKREYTGWDVIDVYRGDGPLKDTLTVFSLSGKLSEVMKEIGWDAAKQTFRSYPDTTNLTPEENFTLFINLLSQYSGKDVRAMFTDAEWANAMKVGSL